MVDPYPIGDHSRRFYLLVVTAIMAALLLTSLAVGSLGALGVTGNSGSGESTPLPANATTEGEVIRTPTKANPTTTPNAPETSQTSTQTSRTPTETPPPTPSPPFTNASSENISEGNKSSDDVLIIRYNNTTRAFLNESNQTAIIEDNGSLTVSEKNLTIEADQLPEYLQNTSVVSIRPQTVQTAPPPYNITIRPQDPAPGSDVMVFVTKDGQPVVGATVAFNEEVIGKTGTGGAQLGTVPYAQTLTVSASRAAIDPAESIVENQLVGGAPSSNSDSVYALSVDTDLAEQGEVSVTLSENISVETDDPLLPGRTATVTATINETPLRNVTLWADDAELGTTNANGVAEITVPASLGQGDNVTIEARRGTYSGHDTVQLNSLELNTSTSFPLSLPFTDANATVTTDNGTHVNASIAVYTGSPGEGTPLVTIENSDSLDFSLPLTQQVTVVAEVGATRLTSPISDMLLHGGIIGAVLLLTFGSSAWLLRRRIDWGRIQALSAIALDTMVRIGQHLADLTDHIVAHLRHLYVALTTRPVEFLSEHLHPTNLISHLLALLSTLRQRLADLFMSGSESAITDTPTDGVTTTQSDQATTPTGSYRRLRAIWQWFVSLAITERRWSHLTITEVTQRGIDRGLPAQPVTRLRRALLDVEYGNRDPSQRLEDTTTAANHIADQTDAEPPKSDHSTTQGDKQ